MLDNATSTDLRPIPAASSPPVEGLADRFGHLPARDLLAALIEGPFSGRIALVSSFGAEAAVLLHLVAAIDARVPVIFLNTGKLFGETLRYRDELIHRLGLRDVRSIEPDPVRVDREDPDGSLWRTNPDRCCALRKVEPLAQALAGFDAWINGRKRSHGALRADLPVIEADGPRIKINPLATWSPDDVAAYFTAHDLPHHPLEADGYSSIGCLPCTGRTLAGEDKRAGRWRGQDKTECGIHTAPTTRGED